MILDHQLRFGQLLKSLREAAGLSTRAAIDKMDRDHRISQTQLLNIEAGRATASKVDLVAFSNVYGVRMDTLLEASRSAIDVHLALDSVARDPQGKPVTLAALLAGNGGMYKRLCRTLSLQMARELSGRTDSMSDEAWKREYPERSDLDEDAQYIVLRLEILRAIVRRPACGAGSLMALSGVQGMLDTICTTDISRLADVREPLARAMEMVVDILSAMPETELI